mmetsp:Transcript_52575/g.122328  ORF Transcript_52575/g.122328 Transcript_52575/m.122328 type:complete len:211 (-) Transcript_52575:4-636(-)
MDGRAFQLEEGVCGHCRWRVGLCEWLDDGGGLSAQPPAAEAWLELKRTAGELASEKAWWLLEQLPIRNDAHAEAPVWIIRVVEVAFSEAFEARRTECIVGHILCQEAGAFEARGAERIIRHILCQQADASNDVVWLAVVVPIVFAVAAPCLLCPTPAEDCWVIQAIWSKLHSHCRREERRVIGVGGGAGARAHCRGEARVAAMVTLSPAA